MANTIISIRSSGVVGNTPSTLQPGELAINYADGKLYYGNSTSQVEIFSAGAETEPSGLNGEIQFNNFGSFGSSESLKYDTANNVLIVPNILVGTVNVSPSIVFASTTANTANQRAVTSGTYANSAFGVANTAITNAATADQKAVSAGSYANAAFGVANTASINALSAGSYANGAFTFANTANSYFYGVNATQNTNITTATNNAAAASSYANSAFNKANNALANTSGILAGDLQVNGLLKVYGSGGTGTGSEGGQIDLVKAATDTTLTTGVTIDVYQNKLRIFETGGTNRGVFIDIANNTSTTVGTDLLAGASAGSHANSAYLHANSAYLHANSAYTSANTSAGYLNQAVKTTSIVTFDSVITSNNGLGTNLKIGDDVWIGDINNPNTLGIRGQQNAAIAYIVFGNADNTTGLGRSGSGPLTYGGDTIWHAGNDGTGSGLDADFLDGLHGSNYARSSAESYANSAYIQANTATTNAATADQRAVTSGSYANSAFGVANTAITNAATADQKAVSAGSYANSAFGVANTASVNATSAGSYANSAFGVANTKYNSSGGTISGDVSITGNLNVVGATITHSANSFVINDPLILLANNNPGNVVDTGFISHYVEGGVTKHSGLVRDSSANTYYLFDSYVPHLQETNTIDPNESTLRITTLKSNLVSDLVLVRGYDVVNHTNSAYTQANTATTNAATADQRAVTSGVYANAAFGVANTASVNATSAGSYANGAFGVANTANQRAVTSGTYANSAYTQANTATTNAATADQRAVTSGVYANAAFGVANTKFDTSGGTITGSTVISANSTTAALRITQVGTGNALLVEDEANPDSSPFVVTATGNVGIGTTSPTTAVSIGGATSVSLGISMSPQGWNSALHRLTVPTSGDTSVWSFNYNGSAVDYSGYATSSIGVGNGAILFSTNTTNTAPTERMRIDSTGNVGIGTNTPGTPLDVNGTVRATQFRLSGTGVIDDYTATTTSNTQSAIAQWSTSAYGGCKVIVEAKDGVNRHITELLITHNGTIAIATEYGIVHTNGQLATYDVDISSGNIRLLATAASANSTAYKVMQTLLFA
jgi:hypothetical protein